MALLDGEDLAYLRETQAEVRPTEVSLVRASASTSDGMGGTTSGGWAEAVPLQVRIVQGNQTSDDLPQDLADRYANADLVKITADLVPLGHGDYLHDATRGRWYQVVSDGLPQDWSTATQVWAILAPDGDPRA